MSKGEVKGDPSEGIAGARKDDTGKAPIYRGVLSYFPRAVAGAASISAFGAQKYAWNGWLHVPDGLGRYSDALLRHLAKEAEGETVDDDSRLPHHLHALWNSLARSELILRAIEETKNNSV